MNPMEHEELVAVVAMQANSLHRRYHRFTERGDIEQELWLAVAKNLDTFVGFLDRDPEDKDAVRQGWSAAHKTLWRHGDRYCRREKAVKTGYRPQDEAFYDRQRIGILLDMRFNGTSFTNQYDDSKPKGKSKPGSGFMLETEYADIDRALSKIDPRERAVVMMHYVDGLGESEIADQYGDDMNRMKVARILDRACKKMVQYLGGESPYPTKAS